MLWINLQLSPFSLPFAKNVSLSLNLKVCMHQLLGGMWNISANITVQLGVVYLTKNWIAINQCNYHKGFHHLPKTSLWCLFSLSVTAAITIHYRFIVPVLFIVWYGQPLNVSCSSAQSDLWKNCLEVWSTVTMKGSEKQRGQSSWTYLGLRIKRGFESLTSMTLLLQSAKAHF